MQRRCKALKVLTNRIEQKPGVLEGDEEMGNEATCLAQPVLPQQVVGCWGCGSSGLCERSRQFDHRQPFLCVPPGNNPFCRYLPSDSSENLQASI